MSSPLVFLSHSSADTDAALALARRLEDSPLGRQHGLEVWVDKRDLVPGPGWKDQLQDALDRSTAFAVYVGSKRIVNWVWDEVSVALDRAHESPGYPVIPILAAEARFDELPSFLSQYHGVSDVERDAEAFAALLRGLLGLDARAPVEAEPEPFQGLEAFTSHRAHLFFGRESDTSELLDLVRTEPLVIVVGDSGSGKSSLVKAGLVPRFRGGGLADSSPTGVALADSSRTSNAETLWRVLESRPLSDPFEKLAEAVLAEAQAYGKSVKECSDLADLVRSRRASSIKDAIHLSGPTGATAKTLLVVDQFEELFTLADAPTQTAFADVLVTLATAADAALRIVLTMRWDYYHLCSNTPPLYARLEADNRRARYTLRRMPVERLRRCVTEPLRLAGVPDAQRETLAIDVLKDVGERPNDLALLEMALQHAWAKRAERGRDLLRTYVAIGRVDGALATAADEVVTTKLTPDEQSLVEPLFIRLVKLGDTGGATRRIASREELDGGRWLLAQKLASKECYRLVVTTDNTVEIAHEAMVTSWPRYVAWLRNDRVTNDLRADDKRHLDALVDDAQRWSAAPETERPLLLAHGFDLERYKALRGRRPSWLCERERSFIDTSTREHERAVEREREAASERARAHQKERDDARTLKRRAYLTALSSGVAIVLAVVAVWYAYDAWRQSDAARIASVVRTAASLADADPTAAALVLATFTGDREPDDVLPVATRVAHEQLATILRGHASPVKSAVFSPDKTRIVTASDDGTARVWHADGTGDPVVLRGHTGSVMSAVFSGDGMRIVTASVDGTARIWRADGAGEPVVLSGHNLLVHSAAFSPDNAHIVTSSEDGTARVWRADGVGDPVVLRGHSGAVRGAAFSPDNRRVVTASADNTARVWSADGTGEPVVLRGHNLWLHSAAFSADSTHIVTSGEDWTARVWSADGTGDPVVLRGHSGPVFSAAFSPDDMRIVTAGGDGTARVWRPDGGGDPVVLRGHSGPVRGAVFSLDSTRIVTVSDDGTARVWSDAEGTGDPLVLRGHIRPVLSADFSPDNTRIVTAGEDGTARVWPAGVASDPIVLRGHTDLVAGAVFSPDNTRIATASWDHTVRVWRADGIGDPVLFPGDRSIVTGAAFSPDSTHIVIASTDGTARVWRADGGGNPVVLRGHGDVVSSATFSHDSTLIATASYDGTARVWRADGSSDPVVLRGHTRMISSAVFGPDDLRIVTASADGTARVWRVDGTGDPVILRGHTAPLRSAVFSPDNTHIVTAGDDGTARVWRAGGTGDPVVLRGHAGTVFGAVFSPDNMRITTASADFTARVWRADGSGSPVVLRGHTHPVRSAAFSPDGTHIVTASADRTARIWRADGTGDPAVLRGHTREVFSVVFSPDNLRILTASADRTARVWRATWPGLLDVLRAGTRSCLTIDERERYLGGISGRCRASVEGLRGGKRPVGEMNGAHPINVVNPTVAQGSRLKAQGSRLRAQGSGLKLMAQGSRLRAQGPGLKAQGSRLKGEGSGVTRSRLIPPAELMNLWLG